MYYAPLLHKYEFYLWDPHMGYTLTPKEKCRKSDAHDNFTYIAMIDHILIHSNLVLSFPRLSITKVVNIVGTIILN